MSEKALRVLLDQNIPRELVGWLLSLRPHWQVMHVCEVGLEGKPDPDIFAWAQQHGAIIVTFDEDFADSRMYPLGSHHRVIRLRVWPTNGGGDTSRSFAFTGGHPG